MLGDISDRIETILDARKRHLPQIRADLEWWRETDDHIAALGRVVAELRKHPATPDELRTVLEPFGTEEIREDIAEAVRLLSVLETRFSRGTINIGVSGQARVGKSTLLQSISGLGDDQIPTGEALPVTAVRSRIYHSAERRRATLRLHSFDTFVTDVISPYHSELELPGLPTTPPDFRGWAYPKPVADGLPGSVDKPSYVTMLNRLQAMQASFSSYEADLTGQERVVALDELRPFVAYPTNDEEQAPGETVRRYLAVRDVRIDCDFPQAQVEHLGIIDLPGLGEVAVRAEQHHVNGLQNEVDIVLLVKRPVEGMAYWGDADARALDLIDGARGFVQKRDFVFIVINSGGTSAPMAAALHDHIRGQVNSGKPDQFFRVLETDAADTSEVFEGVLTPVLNHLADRMPAMDAEVLAGTRAELRAVSSRIRVVIEDLSRMLSSVRHASASIAEDLERRTKRLRQDLAGSLARLVNELREQARSAIQDPGYSLAVDTAYQATREWINSGLGVGQQSWQDEAFRSMLVDHNSSRYAGDELNRVRVEISYRFQGIDAYFRTRVQELWHKIAEIMSAQLGTLVATQDGEVALRRFAELLSDASEPCPRLSDAVHQLLAIRLDYRSQLHPRVRAELDALTLQERDRETGQQRNRIVVEINEVGAKQLYHSVVHIAEQAAHLTKKALLREGLTPALVLHAAAEQFEDTLIRSGDSEREFKRLARSYRDEIWSGVFHEIDAANARVAKVIRARDLLVARLDRPPWEEA
ncbi:MAG: hypothetical protein ACRDSP_03905 [Pseudonocardiaceae bacterium]